MQKLTIRLLASGLLPIIIYAACLLLFSDIYNTISEKNLWQPFLFLTLGVSFITGLVLWQAGRHIAGALRSLTLLMQETTGHKPGDHDPQSVFEEIDDFKKSLNRRMFRFRHDLLELNLEKELFSALLGALRDGVLCLDKKGIVVYQNQALPTHLVHENAAGKHFNSIIINPELLEHIFYRIKSPEIQNSNQAPVLTESAADNAAQSRAIEIIVHNRSYRIQSYPVYLEQKAELYLVVVQDLSAQYRTQKLRQEFLQNASHELKTPITSIRGFTETMLPGLVNENHRRFSEGILRNVDRMERIIEDMVTIASLESRNFPFQPRPINLHSFMEEIQNLMAGTLANKNQTIKIEINTNRSLEADPLLMEHLLLNLISNASRYSPENSEINIRFEANVNEKMRIYVCDRGPGIPADDRDKIFERFYRVDADRSRSQGGTGLGLSIVRQIVRLHGGSVQVKDREGGGSCFLAMI